MTLAVLEHQHGAGVHASVIAELWRIAGCVGVMDPPRIYAISGPTSDTLGGRYFPKKNAALVYRHEDPAVVLATTIHEATHAVNYALRCGGHTKTRCGYVGQHDAKFYKNLEPLYKYFGVSPSIARAVESDCRGDYQCPARWRRIQSW